jgi:hypothetical protein
MVAVFAFLYIINIFLLLVGLVTMFVGGVNGKGSTVFVGLVLFVFNVLAVLTYLG